LAGPDTLNALNDDLFAGVQPRLNGNIHASLSAGFYPIGAKIIGRFSGIAAAVGAVRGDGGEVYLSPGANRRAMAVA
jgi:hypothetical protein